MTAIRTPGTTSGEVARQLVEHGPEAVAEFLEDIGRRAIAKTDDAAESAFLDGLAAALIAKGRFSSMLLDGIMLRVATK